MYTMQHWSLIMLAAMICLTACMQHTPEAVVANANRGNTIPADEMDMHPGRTIYNKSCAACHDVPETSLAPGLDALRQLGSRNIRYTLSDGKMKEHGMALTTAEQDIIAAYLAGGESTDDTWIAANLCSVDRRRADTGGTPVAATFGINASNHRNLSRAESGLSTTDLGDMELAWVIGFPDNVSMRSQPVIVGDTLFIAAVDTAQLFAFDISAEPCVQWVYSPDIPLRTSLSYGTIPDSGRKVLVFSDSASRTHMVDAASGDLIWLTDVKLDAKSRSNTTGTPVLHGDRVYVPISSFEQSSLGANPDYECCRSHGAVTALDAKTGARIWTGHTMEDATPRAISRVGTQQWGPSGAPIWTTPAIDVKRGVLYVGTGQNNSVPPTDTSDAILAYDLEDGSLRWTFQATANDIFLTGCLFERDGPNCPPAWSVFADYDFGASVVIARRSDGRDILLAGQKSGVLWALDPDNKGSLIWERKLGPGGALGGIHWGLAYDGRRVYVPVNKLGGPGEEPGRPGMHAVDVDSGDLIWSYYNEPDCSGDRNKHMPTCARATGLSAAPLIIDNALVHGGLDGFVRVFDTETGRILFQFDTARPFAAVNGVEAHGGSIDNASIVAGNGMLFVGSGYALVGSQGGNVLIALRPRDKRILSNR